MSNPNDIPRVYLAAASQSAKEEDCACADGEAVSTSWYARVWAIVIQVLSNNTPYSEDVNHSNQQK